MEVQTQILPSESFDNSQEATLFKKMDKIFDDETDCKRILREVTLLRKLRHPCVVELIEICQPSDPENFTTIYVVMEFAESDLKKILKSPINLEILHI